MRATVFNRNNAPGFLGAFLFSAACLLSGGCEKKSTGTPDWSSTGGAPSATVSTAPARAIPREPQSATGPLRFMAYNVENWLTKSRYSGGKETGGSKAEKAKQAVVTVIAAVKPDVLGVCELGERADVEELQARLKMAGVDLPNLHYTGGVDSARHLALLSRFPISTTAKASKTTYMLNGKTHGMQRGILDATLQVNGRDYRFLGAHLKSKRDVEEGDQEQMRASEAHLLRDHIDGILASEPATRLIVYGDLNDTKASTVVKTIQGPYNHANSLTPLPLKDRHGEAWTQHWAYEDIYSRFDWILVSKALKPEVDFEASRVIDEPGSDDASDHRAVMMQLE